MAAPGCRGADFQVRTTVASPNGCPASYSRATSSMTSRTGPPLVGEQPGQLLEAREAVPGEELVAVRERRDDPGGQRLVPLAGTVRVQPDDAVREPVQPRHLLAELRGVTALPAVGRDHDDRPARSAALSVPVEELLDVGAEPGPAVPVVDDRGDPSERRVAVALGQLA